MRVKPLHCRYRFTYKSKLGVIIIFYNISARLFITPCNQLSSSFYRHYNTCRILVGRHQIANIRLNTFKLAYIHTFIIHINAYDIPIHRFKNLSCLDITRIFKRYMLSSKQKSQKQYKILTSGTYYNVLRSTFHSSGSVQIIRYLYSKSIFTLIISCCEYIRAGKHFSCDTSPRSIRKTL